MTASENVPCDIDLRAAEDPLATELAPHTKDLVLEIEPGRVEFRAARSGSTHTRRAAALETLASATASFGVCP